MCVFAMEFNNLWDPISLSGPQCVSWYLSTAELVWVKYEFIIMSSLLMNGDTDLEQDLREVFPLTTHSHVFPC